MMKDHCGNCVYFRIAKVERWCSHPLHHTKLKKFGGKCPEWTYLFKKGVLSHEKVPFQITLQVMEDLA